MAKHAYLIMAHNEFTILEKLLKLLDNENNDIYLHIDKKVKNFDFNYFKKLIKKSNLIFTKRLDVRWGSYKQIACEYLLFRMASQKKYAYYHLLSGTDMPLTNQKTVHDFFDKNKGKEFVCFDNHQNISESAIERVKYYHLFVNLARSKNKLLCKFFQVFHFHSIKFQKKLKINRLKKVNYTFRKGANWVSVTDEFVKYLLSKEKEVKKIFKYSYCADELFVQTILYNSKFYKNVYSIKNDDYLGIKRYIDWKRGEPYTFTIDDYDLLINSDCFWARKFSSKKDKEIINKIYEKVVKDSE